MDRYLLVRAASIYIAVAATAAVWMWRRPGDRAWSGEVDDRRPWRVDPVPVVLDGATFERLAAGESFGKVVLTT